MFLVHIIVGLLLSGILWLGTFSLGALFLIAVSPAERDQQIDNNIIDLLVATAVGFSELMFGLFVVLAAHLFYPVVIAMLFCALFALSIYSASRRIGVKSVSEHLRRSIAASITPFWSAVLIFCVLLSPPAILPPDSYDSTMYHFAYAIDWSNAHYLTLDPYLRFPVAQFNVELLYALFFSFHLSDYVQFITWTCYAISATGIVALTSALLRKAGAPVVSSGVGGFLTGCVFLSCPIVLRCADVGLVDIPAGMMFLGFAVAAIRAREDFTRYAFAMAMIGGAFIGIKLALLPSFALFAALIIILGRYSAATTAKIIGTIALLAIFTCPWYLRNIVVAGDPVDPIINLALHHSDPFWNQVDLDGQKGDLRRNIPLIANPVWFFLFPTDAQGAVSFSFCLLYLPIVGVVLIAFNKALRQRAPEFAIFVTMTAFAICQMFAVSNRIARYALHYYALFLVVVAIAFWMFLNWLSRNRVEKVSRWVQFSTLIAIAALALPPPTPIIEYNNVKAQFGLLDLGVSKPKAVLSKTYGYNEADDLASLVASSRTGVRVLTLNFEYLAYFFREKGVVQVGDWWGQGRIADLVTAIENGSVPAYLDRLRVGAFMLRAVSTSISPQDEAKLISALRNDDYSEITKAESDIREFVRNDVLTEAYKHGFPRDRPVVASDSIDFEEQYPYGQIGLDPRRSFAPGDRSANIYQVLNGDTFANSITVISGNDLSFHHLRSNWNSSLSFDVAKVFSIGTPAVAWIDVSEKGRRQRIFSKIVPKASGDEPFWEHVTMPVSFKTSDATLIFGASSINGGGIGDWIAYVHPIMTHARFVSKRFDNNTLRLAKVDQDAIPANADSSGIRGFLNNLMRRLGFGS